jgi:RNA polymerase sigma factor (sigma-70 family)
VRNQKDAEDLTQEAFIQIYQSLSSYQKQGFKTWMVRIATNKAIDFKRKQLRSKEELTEELEQPQTDLAGHQNQQSPDKQVIQQEKKELVHEKIADVPENYRGVILAYYIQEKSYKEIATEQGIEIKTVEMKLYRARKWMQKHWREEEFR